MQKILFADRAYLAVTEESCQAQGPKSPLDHLRVMIRSAKKTSAATIATAEAAAVNPGSP